MKHWLWIIIVCLASEAFAEPAYLCRQTETPIRLDGKADDPGWRHALEISSFFLPGKTPTTSATSATKAKLLWDARYLYYFAEMEDSELRATRKDRDGELWLDDVFELFVKPSAENDGYYEFQANPLGTMLDIFYPERSPKGYLAYKNKGRFGHAAKVVVKGTLNDSSADTGWQVEGRIPWSDFKPTGGGPKPGDEWRFMLCRYDYDSRYQNKRQAELSVSSESMIRDFHAHEHYAPIRFVGPFDPKTALPAWLQKVGPIQTKLVGSPDPPPPYKAERVLENLSVSRLIDFQFEPGTDQILFVDQPPGTKGSRLVRLLDRASGETNVLLDFDDETIYSIEFHPRYQENGQFFASLFGPMKAPREERRVHLKRYQMSDGEVVSPEGELIIEWETWGHTGGAMAFDDDGLFYVTTGDGTGDSDTRLAGQDLTHLLAKVLRIDVDQPTEEKPYSVPPDNPFVGMEKVRPETFAYGLRNPWRMVWDKKLKRLWVGNNGQDLFEQVYLIEAGGNYGWSVYEGSQPFYIDRPRGPHPILPPTLEHHHGESRSLTGGMIYTGNVLPELHGAYIYGDHSTGKIWAARHDGKEVTWSAEIADTTLAIPQFNNDPETGDLLVAHHGQTRDGGGIYRLVPNPPAKDIPPFPTKLSDTDIFIDIANHKVREEFLPYDVVVPQWADGAEVARYVALSPGNPTVRFGGNRGWNFPDGTVVFQTLTKQDRRLETRVMIRQEKEWTAYSYAWNEAQTDAELVPPDGGELSLPNGNKWKIPSRVDCMNCHSRAANFVLGLQTAQLNTDRDYGNGYIRNQLEVMDDLGLFLQQGRSKRTSTMKGPVDSLERLCDPFDEGNPDINARARSLLHARCSGCHRESGGGNAMMHLQHFSTPEKFGVIEADPNHGDQGLGIDAKIIKPGDPTKSVMFYRVVSAGPGMMPPVGQAIPDPKAGPLLMQWILSLKTEQ